MTSAIFVVPTQPRPSYLNRHGGLTEDRSQARHFLSEGQATNYVNTSRVGGLSGAHVETVPDDDGFSDGSDPSSGAGEVVQ